MSAAPSAKQVCPLCSFDDDVELVGRIDGVTTLVCQAARDDHPYRWEVTPGGFVHTTGNQLAREIGLYENLLEVVDSHDRYLEHGIIEYRYAIAHPKSYELLVKHHGHTALGSSGYSASNYIGKTLGSMCDRRLQGIEVKATGYWSYNGRVWAYAPTPGPSDGAVLQWDEYARSIDVGPDDWPPLGYDHSIGSAPHG